MLEVFQGSIGKAIELKSKEEEYLKIEQAISSLESENLIDLINYLDILYTSKDEILEMLDYINVLLLRKSKENVKYTGCIKLWKIPKEELLKMLIYDIVLIIMLFNIWEEVV